MKPYFQTGFSRQLAVLGATLGSSENTGHVFSLDLTQISLTLEDGLESGNNWS